MTESDVLTPTRDWIPSVISDFLRAGTRDDKKAYDPSLLPQGWSLIEILVRRSIKQNDADPSRAKQAKDVRRSFSEGGLSTLPAFRLGLAN